MTHDRRRYVGTKSPALTPDADDRPAAACEDRLDLVEAIWEGSADERRFAYRHLMPKCAGCPLRPTCWADSKWRAALKGAAS